MNALIVPVNFEKEELGRTPPSRVSWPFAVACCLYYLFAYRGLTLTVPIFGELFTGLGVVPPLPTRLLLANHSWIFPLCFCGAVVLVIYRQLVPLNRIRLRIANVILVFVGVALAPLVVLTMYLPLFDLMRKLHSAK
jgi:hypothetical protein